MPFFFVRKKEMNPNLTDFFNIAKWRKRPRTHHKKRRENTIRLYFEEEEKRKAWSASYPPEGTCGTFVIFVMKKREGPVQ